MQAIQEIKADLKAIQQTSSAMRWFGLLLGSICLVIAGIMFFWGQQNPGEFAVKPAVFAGLGSVCILMALVIPMALKPVNTVFLIVSMIVGWIMTRVVLTLLFFGLFLPIGLILRMSGKDSMCLKFDREAQSYWIPRTDETFDPVRCRRLF